MTRNLLTFSLVLLSTLTAAAQQHDRATADADQINSAYQKYSTNEYRQLFQPGYFGADFEDQIEGHRVHLAKLEAFEENDLPKLRELLSRFRARYGADRGAIRNTFQEINNAGGSIAGDPGYSWEKLQEVVAAPAETRRKLADELVKLDSSGGQTHQGYNIMTVEESYAQAKAFLELAVAYQPDHEEAKAKLAAIDGDQQEQLAANAKAIDEAVFGDHAASFQGPGTTEEMAAIATKYMSSKESGKDGNLLALRIAGDWQVADQNILGDTLTWGLPIEVALRQHDDPETAKVVSVELITRGDEQRAPFQRHRFFSARYVRVANLPQRNAAASGFGMLRIPLAGLLVVLGLVAAAPFVETRVPALKSALAVFKPVAPMLGVAALGLGATALTLSIFSPLRDVLPQAAAIVVGLMMGLDILIKRTSLLTTEVPSQPNDTAPDDLKQKAHEAVGVATEAAKQAVTKAQDLLIEKQASIRRLDAVRVPIGMGCLVVGLMHLVLGGFPLF